MPPNIAQWIGGAAEKAGILPIKCMRPSYMKSGLLMLF
jgi:hypothetical protein